MRLAKRYLPEGNSRASRVSSITFFEGILGVRARDGALGTAAYDAVNLQGQSNGLVLHLDACSLGHVINQASQRPQQERQPSAVWTLADHLH